MKNICQHFFQNFSYFFLSTVSGGFQLVFSVKLTFGGGSERSERNGARACTPQRSPQAKCEGVPYGRPADSAWIFRETPKADESPIAKVR